MDKTEHLASIVIQSVQVFLEKRMAPIVEGLAALKRDAGAFLTRDEAVMLVPDTSGAMVRMDAMGEEIKALRAELASRPSLEMIRAEQANAANKAAAELFATLRVPEDGKSVTVDEVRPLLEQMVAAIPVPKDADPVDYVRIGEVITRAVDATVSAAFEAVPKPKDGEDAKPIDPEIVRGMIETAVERRVLVIPKPKDGESVTLDDVRPLIAVTVEAEVGKAVAGIRIPEDGLSVTLDDIRPMVQYEVGRIPIPRDGESVTLEQVAPMIEAAVARIPVPKDGTSVPPAEVKAMVDAEVARAVALIPKSKDGEDGDGVDLPLLNELVGMSVKAAFAEIPRPKDGEDGEDADPVDMNAVEGLIANHVTRQLATWERPKDGADGLGFDDFSMDLKDDGRTIVHRLSRGERTKTHEIVAPWLIYRGVYESGRKYQKCDVVSYAGSMFVAERDTSDLPGQKGTGGGWLLSVKRGKDAE